MAVYTLRVVWAVNANWNSGNGWNVEANSVDNPNRWNADNQVFSRYPYLSSARVAEVFVSRPLRQPPTMRPTSSMPSPILAR